MESMPHVSYLAGILVRLAVPIAITLLAAYGLRRLDQRWQQQATSNQSSAAGLIKCWVLNDCPSEQRANCAVYQERRLPCWQAFRDEAGRLPTRCLDCDVFRQAPVIEPV